jgi:hypothetical protein
MRQTTYQFVVIAIIALCIWPTQVLGTAQYPEKLSMEGNEHAMMATPLEDFFTKTNPKPKELWGYSSACWRGYIGKWEIKSGQLFLVEMGRTRLRSTNGKAQELYEIIPLSLVFPKQAAPILADWFSGVLRLPRGKQLQYVHMGFGSIYEEDVFLNVVKGHIVGRRVVDNRTSTPPSAVDLAWRELGRSTDSGGQKTRPPETSETEESGQWLDGRGLRDRMDELIASRGSVAVRGIFFTRHLWLVDVFDLPLDLRSIKSSPREGIAAELAGTLERSAETGIVFRVISARELPLGRAIERQR